MNESIKKDNVWDSMIPEIKKEILKNGDNDITAQSLKKRLQSIRNYRLMTWGEIININLYGNTSKLLTPREFIIHES